VYTQLFPESKTEIPVKAFWEDELASCEVNRVLLLGDPATVTEDHSSASSVPNVIVCAIGMVPAGDVIPHWASEFAAGFGSRLMVVNAVTALEFCPEIALIQGDIRATAVKEAQKQIREELHA
jgi:hypothetical protein